MLITLIGVDALFKLPPILLEAEQGETWQALEDTAEYEADGLFCGGLATCYAIVFKNSERTALAHSVFADSVSLKEMFDYVTNNNACPCEIILARSKNSYTEQLREDAMHGEAPLENADAYFSRMDASYIQGIQAFSKSIPITLVDLPHDILMISNDGKFYTFEECPLGKLSFEEISTDSKYTPSL